MAGIRIEPPEPFVFAKPDGWPQWKRRFEQFIIASGVSEESELRKVSTLLYCLGPPKEKISCMFMHVSCMILHCMHDSTCRHNNSCMIMHASGMVILNARKESV